MVGKSLLELSTNWQFKLLHKIKDKLRSPIVAWFLWTFQLFPKIQFSFLLDMSLIIHKGLVVSSHHSQRHMFSETQNRAPPFAQMTLFMPLSTRVRSEVQAETAVTETVARITIRVSTYHPTVINTVKVGWAKYQWYIEASKIFDAEALLKALKVN